ncbi:DUF2797 domain-containing protein [Halobacteria archaeon AArc-m2/3/4]|uniref:DUF2797 domain-containing protein n=1 Tax=Natronoglomus mannanivorans TaxID=2979990 RepID=A0ABT2QA53_9EURY|nr:DUF2797 domain-containing protein [Halobacteria archaeon AArc-m2/3/4]
MQIVGYEPSARGPALLLSERSGRDGANGGASESDDVELAGESDHGIRRRPLEPGDRLSYTLGARHCAGAIDGEVHHPCDRPATPYCEYHTSTWVCARCTGTCLKDEMDCYEEHAVYLAAFAPDTFKVGVTKRWRLETRLREQGADRGAHVHTVSNGRIARELEAEIASQRGLTDRVRTAAKLESLAPDVTESAWEALLAEFDVRETFSFDYGLELEAQPVAETMGSGTVVGVKGRLLVLERGGTNYGVDMRDLVGYELVVDEESSDSGPRLQSSLGSFG